MHKTTTTIHTIQLQYTQYNYNTYKTTTTIHTTTIHNYNKYKKDCQNINCVATVKSNGKLNVHK